MINERMVGARWCAGSAFGTSKNDKGFKVLPPYIRLIQGDGIDLAMYGNFGPAPFWGPFSTRFSAPYHPVRAVRHDMLG